MLSYVTKLKSIELFENFCGAIIQSYNHYNHITKDSWKAGALANKGSCCVVKLLCMSAHDVYVE